MHASNDRRLRAVAVIPSLFACFVVTGCQRHLFSPPARTVPLDAPRVLAKDETAIQVVGSQTDAIFDAKVLGGTVGVRRGIAEGVELQAEASGYHASSSEETRAPVSRNAAAGRIGTKVALVGHHVSFLGGVGGGAFAGGGFLTPDVGVTVGYDNPYFIPFLLGRVGLSQPVGARTVDLSRPDEPAGTALSRPQTSYFYGFTLGGRVPIEPKGAKLKGAVLGGLSFSEIRDKDEHNNGTGFTLGGELIF